MRATLLKDTIKSLFPIQRTICIEGSPGGGKTTIVQQVAEELGVPCIERHMPTMLVEDFGILFPEAENNTLHYKLPDWFADLQKVLANICQARTLHGVPMPDGWQVISTGNRQADRAGANRVLGHLRNRETVFDLDTHLDDWTAWALQNNVKPELISFIRFRPNLLHDYDPQRDQNATPRSWVEGVSDVLGTVPAEAEYESFKGAVGEGCAAEFVGFVKIFRKLPNPDNILLNPTTSAVPTDPATLYALSGAIAERATENNFERVCTYAERMPPEFSVLTISYAARKKPELANTQAFTKWSIQHQEVLF
jgi:hypothetical protein